MWLSPESLPVKSAAYCCGDLRQGKEQESANIRATNLQTVLSGALASTIGSQKQHVYGCARSTAAALFVGIVPAELQQQVNSKSSAKGSQSSMLAQWVQNTHDHVRFVNDI